ncbi:MAG: DUF4097 family beta strand repeat protein [Phycisphaerae bacterium]|nr:DUF4097 family beta strand repeat protein [Phycisphaerae bacterium]
MTRTSWSKGLLVLLVLPLVGCQSYPFRATVEFRETAALDGIRRIEVETQNGLIEVKGDASRKDMDLRAEKVSHGVSTEDARVHAEKVEIAISRDASHPDRLRIIVKVPLADKSRSAGASLWIELPPDLAAQLETTNGCVLATDLNGGLDAETTNGSVTLAKLKNKIRARSTNGKIIATDIGGEVDVGTSNGAVELTRVSGGRIKAVSTNGRIKATQIRAAAVLQSTNGGIELRAESVPDQPEIRLTTTNGSVKAFLPGGIRARLGIWTTNGRIHANLDGAKVGDIDSGKSHLKATLNGGGGLIDIKTTNGSVDLEALAGEDS